MKHRRWRTEGLADLHVDDPKQTDINWNADLHLVIRHQNTLRTFRWAVQPSVWLHCLHFPKEVFITGPNFMMKKWSFSCSSSASVKYERSFQGGDSTGCTKERDCIWAYEKMSLLLSWFTTSVNRFLMSSWSQSVVSRVLQRSMMFILKIMVQFCVK